MNIITRKRNSNYTTISNVFLRDIRLSCKAKGILAVIMGLPGDWDFSIRGILSITKEGRDAVYSAIKELKDHGYCEVSEQKDNNGKFKGYSYCFSDEALLQPLPENPHPENPHPENPHPENPPQLNTYIIKDLNNNTKSTNVDYSVSTREETDLFEVESNNDPLPSEVFGFTAKGLDVTKKTIERTDKLFTQLTFPFESEDFKRLFYVLMTQPKWRVKTKTLTAMQANLNEIAQFEEEFAKSLIQQSISKGWASLVYESTPKQYLQWLREKTGATNQYQQNNSQQYKTKQYFANDEHREIYERYLTETFD
ncbi:hypothetical protein BF695P2_00033 [Bacteroides phage BF695P2]|nr:hypothetical protein BF695P2_00033 [Bacteroides phage BF695P2]WAX07221.1 hypothetical protein BF695P3_00034 [Bacteroides phage BF695P3]